MPWKQWKIKERNIKQNKSAEGITVIIFGTDFDDTLFFHDGRGVRQIDIDAIHRFKEAGYQFGLVSGRGRVMWPQTQAQIQNKVDFDFKIYSNGACICDKDNNVLWETFLPEDLVKEVWNKAKEANVDLILHGQDAMLFSHNTYGIDGRIVHSLDDFDPAHISAMSFDNQTPQGIQFYNQFADREDFVLVANSQFADFNPKGVSKGAALNRLAHEMQQNQKAMSVAIGDSFNDLTMLQEADVSFTFPNSPQEVREAATYQVDGIHEAVDCILAKIS